jgi:hypothetical protein
MNALHGKTTEAHNTTSATQNNWVMTSSEGREVLKNMFVSDR